MNKATQLFLYGVCAGTAACGANEQPQPDWIVGRWALKQTGQCVVEFTADNKTLTLRGPSRGHQDRWYITDGKLWFEGKEFAVRRDGGGELFLRYAGRDLPQTTEKDREELHLYRC